LPVADWTGSIIVGSPPFHTSCSSGVKLDHTTSTISVGSNKLQLIARNKPAGIVDAGKSIKALVPSA